MDKEKKFLISEQELRDLVRASSPFQLGPHFTEDNIVEIAKSQFPQLEAQVAMHRVEQETVLSRLKELEWTKRFLIGVAGLCLIAGAALIVFAPAGKEGVSYAVAAAITVLSMGAIGVQEFRIRTIGVRIEGGRDSVISGAAAFTRPTKPDEPGSA